MATRTKLATGEVEGSETAAESTRDKVDRNGEYDAAQYACAERYFYRDHGMDNFHPYTELDHDGGEFDELDSNADSEWHDA